MQWKYALTVLVFTTLSCYFGGCTQPEPEVAPPIEPLPATDTPAPIPLASPEVLEEPSPPTADSPVTDENRIQFPSNGTWVEIGTHLEKGSSKQYVLSAMKGQMMSVSVKQSWPFIVEVADEMGLLTNPNYERPFWRGALPDTQDYFITVKAQATGDFTLRVAINPPGQTYQYFDYLDSKRSLALRYSDEFAPISEFPVGAYQGVPSLALMFINLDFYSPKTNLGEAYFLFGEMEDAQTADACSQPTDRIETIKGQKTINNFDFTHIETGDAGAGNIYDQVIYRTFYNSVCYEMVFFMHSGNIGNYTPGTVEEFDRATLLQKFEAILSTLTMQ